MRYLKVSSLTSKAAWIPATMYLDAKAYRTVLRPGPAPMEMISHQKSLTAIIYRAPRLTFPVLMRTMHNIWTTLGLSTKCSVTTAFHRALLLRLHRVTTTWTALIPVQARLHALVSAMPTDCVHLRKTLVIHLRGLPAMAPILSSSWLSVQCSWVPTVNQLWKRFL